MNLREVSHAKNVPRGFTLIELLLVATIVMLVGVFVLPVGFRAYESQLLTETTDGIGGALRRAQGFALAGRHGASFGVYFTEDAYTLFEGESYALRNAAADEVTVLPRTVIVQAPSDVLFAAATGVPNAEYTIEVANDYKTAPLRVLATGIIEW